MKNKKQKNNFIKPVTVFMIIALISFNLKVSSQCTAGFTYTVNPANNGEATFTNTSLTGVGSHYNWNFGDGTNDYTANPLTHIFNGNGKYYVCLNIIDSLAFIDSTLGCYKTYCDTVNIINTSATCNAQFFPIYDTLSNGIHFINTSGGSITSYLWDFGDGTTSTLGNPGPHPYLSGGSYKICLTTSNPATMCNSNFCDSIFISSCQANFSYVADLTGNGCSFNGSSTGNSTTYFWDFGDDSTSTLQNPYHAFAYNGEYHVCFTTSSATDTTCKDSFCQYINMSGLCDASYYIFNDSTTLFNYKAYVIYPNNNSTYLWNFGDGSTSTLQYPTHNYAGNGPYYLCLTVTGSNSCTDTYCDSLYAGRSTGLTFTVIDHTVTGVHENKIKSNNVLMNYPNPFSKITTIEYSITQNAKIEITVIDLLGNKITTIDQGNKTSGNYTTQWNAENISSGIYLLQLKVNNEVSTKKLIITQ